MDRDVMRRAGIWAAMAGGVFGMAAWAQEGGSPDAGSPPAQPEAQPAAQPPIQPEQLPRPMQAEEEITFPAFGDGVELLALVKWAAGEMGINMDVDPGLAGQKVYLNAPISFPKSRLLVILNAMLEQRGYAITYDDVTSFYRVGPKANVSPTYQGDLRTTRVITTPGIKPSAISQVAQGVMTDGQVKAAYLDDIGAIIVTASPRLAQAYEDAVARIVEELRAMELMVFDVRYVAAPVARQQLIELSTGIQQTGQAGQTGQPLTPPPGTGQPAAATGATAGQLSNLSTRLIVAPNGNSLIFRGRAEERAEVERLLNVIDRPSELEFRRYFTGSSTRNIARHASERGLGPVTEFSEQESAQQAFQSPGQQPGQQAQVSTQTGGSRIVSDPATGWIGYYGTPEQHETFAEIARAFGSEGEILVVRVYKLRHSNAKDVETVLTALIQNQAPAGELPLGPTGQGPPSQQSRERPFTPPETGEQTEEDSFTGGPDVFVIADEANNQVVVKAPLRQQQEFKRLIEKLDLQRPQVHLRTQIVAVTATDDIRLRFETQLINAGGEGGVIQFNTGLSSPGEGGITAPKVVAAGLSGFTGALLTNDYVPIIVQALQTNVDGRILATPSILVNDNEEAELTNQDIFPFQTQSQTNNSVVQGFEEAAAGTTFGVTPHISDGGDVRLEFNIVQSAFTGSPPIEGAPPPKRETTVNGFATVPHGMTIVVGGLTFENTSETVLKIPLLGDIPLVGHLFRDTQKQNQKTVIYIFITPTVVRDTQGEMLTLLTKGPRAVAGIEDDIPSLTPIMVELHDAEAFLATLEAGTVERREPGPSPDGEE